jgi:glucose dehydrogenase
VNLGSRSTRLARRLCLVVGMLVTAAGGTVHAQEGRQPHAVVTPTPLGPAIPPEVTRYADDWPVAQHDLAGTRATTASAIDATNVATLEVAWRFRIEGVGGYGGMTAPPLVAGDTVYVQDMRSNVFALDRETGAVRWERAYDVGTIGPNGLALAYGLIFGATGDTAEVFALDAATGDERWRVRLSNHPFEGIDMAPAVYDSVVYVSTVGGNTHGFNRGGTRGVLFALDAATGATLWTFDTTTDNLWGNPRINSGGGLWYPPSFDKDGNLYFGVGNAAPWAGTPEYPNGASRPGDNDYASSIVSLDPATGSVRWHHNAEPHSLFDHDFQNTPVLVTVSIDGTATDLAIGSGKTGTILAAKQNGGEVIWEIPIGLHQNDDLTELPAGEAIEVAPGAWGGVVSPVAYADGTLFVPVVDLPTRFSSTGYDKESMFDFAKATGELVAIAVTTGNIEWTVDLPTPAFAGATVVNDVVLTAGLDGMVRGFDTATGRAIWTYQTTAGINAPPAVTGSMIFVPAAGPRVVSERSDADAAAPEIVNELIALRLPDEGTPKANRPGIAMQRGGHRQPSNCRQGGGRSGISIEANVILLDQRRWIGRSVGCGVDPASRRAAIHRTDGGAR